MHNPRCKALLVILGLCSLSAGTIWAQTSNSKAQAHNIQTHTVTFDHYSLMIDGRRTAIWAGEFHYWRLPSPDLWRDVLQKMKASGYNAASIYFDWGFHSPAPGVFDFTGIRNVDALLDMATQVGIYVIARPGPYINAETDNGGLPAWLSREPGKLRTNDPDYLAFALDWQRHIDAIIARHLLTNGGGTVILYQVENEFTNTTSDGQAYMQALENQARADGIALPLTHNDMYEKGRWVRGTGAVDMYGFDDYTLHFNCSAPAQWRAGPPDFSNMHEVVPTEPIYIAEDQGGAFDPWGGPGYDKCRQLTGPEFERVFYTANIASGATLQSFYMTYGGTSWGWLPFPGVYTSYDYGAAIDETRRLTEKIPAVKELAYLVQSVEPLTKTDLEKPLAPTDAALRVDARVNPDTHTQFFFVRHADGTSTLTNSTRLTFTARDGTYTVPQQAGAAIAVDGRDAKIIIADYDMDGQHLVYATAQLMTHVVVRRQNDTDENDEDIAVFAGRTGDAGEIVLRYSSRPVVKVLAGEASSTYEQASGDLRLNYTAGALTAVSVSGEGRPPLLLLVGDDGALARLWKLETAVGPVLILGPYLARSASIAGSTLALSGDIDAPTPLEIWAPAPVTRLTWNSKPLNVAFGPQGSGSFRALVAGPNPVALPALTNWRYKFETPEAQPEFDDSKWTVIDHKTANHENLNEDEYGFHHGDVWYRGHFTATGSETAVNLTAATGTAGVYSVWLNGKYLGAGDGSGKQRNFALPSEALRREKENVISVLVRNMGHDEGGNKHPRGVTAAAIVSSAVAETAVAKETTAEANEAVTWRIQGNQGGEKLADPVRGVMNNGGLFGERNGEHLPNFSDESWQSVTLPHTDSIPGIAWYRTTFRLSIPTNQDVPIVLHFDPAGGIHNRVLIFINGWNMGQYVSDVGPQVDFQFPPGILHTRGSNSLALAVWSPASGAGGLGRVSLVQKGNYATGLNVNDVPAP